MGRGGKCGGGGGGGGGGGRGGKGGKGPKPQFTRVIPKFLQQYETMLNGPKPGRGGPDEEDAPAMAESSGMPGQRRNNRDQEDSEGRGGGGGAPGRGGVGGGGGNSSGAFGDYDEEEVAALEAYMKTHPSKEEDKIALRKRARELSASIRSGQGPDAKRGGAQRTRDVLASEAGVNQGRGGGELPSPESPIEYTDASGKLKFNKRRAAGPAAGGGGSSVAGKDNEGSRDKKAKAKRAKLAKLNNAKLLSFGSDEDG